MIGIKPMGDTGLATRSSKKNGPSEDIEARNLTRFLRTILKLEKNATHTRCFRGQDRREWKVKPAILRDYREGAEPAILSELMVEAPLEFGSDKSMFSKLVRAQHYGLPTRLLDVTMNPLVALYFACCDTSSADGVVHIFDFSEERVKFADSDAVSVICNLAKLSHSELQRIRAAYRASGPWTKSKVTAFRQLAPIERLIQFVRVEKPYFLNVIKPVDVAKYFFVYPEKTNRRVIAQSGAFVAAGILRFDGLEKSSGVVAHQIIIPSRCKSSIIDELDQININSRSLFPEIESVSKYISRRWVVPT